jgi:putative membrane protein
VLLILQLTSAGGTYPPPLLPWFFDAVHPLLPMTYLVDAFRIAISGGELSHLLRDVTVLLLVAVVALGLAVAAVHRRKQFRMADLHPALITP